MNCLNNIYLENIYSPLTLSWTLDNVERLVLSQDDDAIAFLSDLWKIEEGDRLSLEAFAGMVAE